MTSAERAELMRLLERHPRIGEHVEPLWRLKRFESAQLLQLAQALGIDLGTRAAGEWKRPTGDQPRKILQKKVSQAPAPSGPPAQPARGLRLVTDTPADVGAGSLRVVTSTSDHDFRQEHARSRVRWALVDLAANMLRVIRGAGRPHDVTQQAITLLEAMQAYHKDVGVWPSSDEIANALAFEDESDRLRGRSDIEQRRYYAEHSVLRGALQVVASSLVGQRTQQTAGHSEMYGGINEIGEVRAEERSRWAAQFEASRPKRQPKRVTGKPTKRAPKRPSGPTPPGAE